MKAHPAVPAQIVLDHLRGSQNRVGRSEVDSDRVRRGLRRLHESAMDLRAALAHDPSELAVLESGLFAAVYMADQLLHHYEQIVRVEQAFQQELKLWLARRPPSFGPLPAPSSSPRDPSPRWDGVFIPSTGREVPTPPLPPQGREVPTEIPDAKIAVGYYTMNDSTRIYVNASNEPCPAPSFEVPEIERAPGEPREGYTPLAVAPPTIDELHATSFPHGKEQTREAQVEPEARTQTERGTNGSIVAEDPSHG